MNGNWSCPTALRSRGTSPSRSELRTARCGAPGLISEGEGLRWLQARSEILRVFYEFRRSYELTKDARTGFRLNSFQDTARKKFSTPSVGASRCEGHHSICFLTFSA